MALSDGNRKRNAAAAAKVLPQGTPITECVLGRGHFRFTTGAGVVTAIFVVAFVVALLKGLIIFPGFLLIFYIFSEVRPQRSVIVTDRSLVVLGHGTWVARPKHVLEQLPLAPVYAAAPKGSAELALGSETITLQRPEFERLGRAVNAAMSAGYPGAAGFGTPGVGSPPGAAAPWDQPPADPRSF